MTKMSKFNIVAKEISAKTGVGLTETIRTLSAYVKYLAATMDEPVQERDPLLFGIMKIDSIIELFPGITVVYSENDVGKTSFLKTMAMNLARQHQIVLYIDAECKLYLHQLDHLTGVYFSTSRELDAIRDFLDTGFIDVVIVDTISSMPHNTLKAFMFSSRKKVPFLVFSAQMRIDWTKKKKVPACSDSILSSAHTHIYLTESEKISFERVDMKRVQFSLIKYEPDVHLAGTRSSFVISENMVSNFWSSIDHLHSTGIIRAHGRDKYLDGTCIGRYSDVLASETMPSRIINLAWSSISDREVDYGVFQEPRTALQWLPTEEHESEPDNIPAGETELAYPDSC